MPFCGVHRNDSIEAGAWDKESFQWRLGMVRSIIAFLMTAFLCAEAGASTYIVSLPPQNGITINGPYQTYDFGLPPYGIRVPVGISATGSFPGPGQYYGFSMYIQASSAFNTVGYLFHRFISLGDGALGDR